MDSALTQGRIRLEWGMALALATAAGVGVVLLGGVATRYAIATVLAALGVGALCLMPDRRAICVALWVLIAPLSVETVFYVKAPVYPTFLPQPIVINAADAVTALLLVFLAVEAALTRTKAFYWSRPTLVWVLFALWGLMSLSIHTVLMQDTFTGSAGLELLRYMRLLMFALVIQSALRTRRDVVLVLVAILVIVLFESVLVWASHFTNGKFNFAWIMGVQDQLPLMTFSNGLGGEINRATGTVGHTNEQARFHTLFTLPLLALLISGKRWLRWLTVLTIFASGVAMLFTFSRGAWVSFGVGALVCIVMVLRRYRLPRSAWISAATMAIGVAVVLAVMAPAMYERLVYGDEGATASRLRMMELATNLWKLHPLLGVGPGEYVDAALQTFPPGYHSNDWYAAGHMPDVPGLGHLDVAEIQLPWHAPIIIPIQVHNAYLLVMAELGVPGLLLWLWMFIEFLRAALACSRSKDLMLQLVGIGGVGATTAALVYMNVDLFDTDKAMQVLLFISLFVTGAARCARNTDRALAEQGQVSTVAAAGPALPSPG